MTTAKRRKHGLIRRAAAAGAAVLLVLCLLMPLTVFAAGDWDTYIKDPGYTVISEIGAASYDKKRTRSFCTMRRFLSPSIRREGKTENRWSTRS